MSLENNQRQNLPEFIESVESVRILSSVVTAAKLIEDFGPFRTKSGGSLEVIFGFALSPELGEFFRYDGGELSGVPEDIRGLRIYEIDGLKYGSIGGTEFHRIRKEVLAVGRGSVTMMLEDLKGQKREFVLKGGDGLFIPPFVKHTYRVEEDNTKLVVVANTLFDPSNPQTFDTYSDEEFDRLKTSYRSS